MTEDREALIEMVRAAAERALSTTVEVNGGELESVVTIYRPSGLAVLVVNEFKTAYDSGRVQ